jgi:hypothetical protein
MPTNTLGVAARQDPRQVTNTLKKTIQAGDAAHANGVAVPFANYLPQNAFITSVWVEVAVGFNGTTPTVTVGISGGTANSIVAAGDVTWTAAAAAIDIARSKGRALTAAGDVLPTATLNFTNTTLGTAIVVIEFEGGWQS